MMCIVIAFSFCALLFVVTVFKYATLPMPSTEENCGDDCVDFIYECDLAKVGPRCNGGFAFVLSFLSGGSYTLEA
jgi:hypothetical protein